MPGQTLGADPYAPTTVDLGKGRRVMASMSDGDLRLAYGSQLYLINKNGEFVYGQPKNADALRMDALQVLTNPDFLKDFGQSPEANATIQTIKLAIPMKGTEKGATPRPSAPANP